MGKSNITPQQLQEILARIGLVQEDFAMKFKVRQSTVSRWLNGQVPVPGYVEAWLREAHPQLFRPREEEVVDAYWPPNDGGVVRDEE